MTEVRCNDSSCVYNHDGQCMRVSLALRMMCVGEAMTCMDRVVEE